MLYRALVVLMRIMLFCSVFPVHSDTLCTRLIEDADVVPKVERKPLGSLCQTTLRGHSGPIVALENGYLPFPAEFYIEVPHDAAVQMASGAMIKMDRIANMKDWPYGVIRIGRVEMFRIYENANSKNVEWIEAPSITVARKACDRRIRVVDFDASTEDLRAVMSFQEIHIGDSAVVLVGGTINLAMVLVETFARLNCARTTDANVSRVKGWWGRTSPKR